MVTSIRQHPLAWFFTLAYAFSWAFWIPAAAACTAAPSAQSACVACFLLVTLGPGGTSPFRFQQWPSHWEPQGRSVGCLARFGLDSDDLALQLSGGSIAAVAFLHAALDIFMTPSVSPQLPNVMGALLTTGTLLLIPIVGSLNLARRRA
jgi:hypothetical protein